MAYLALRTIVGAALRHPGFFDNCSAHRAGMTLPAVHGDPERARLEHTINVGALGFNRFHQNRMYCTMQPMKVICREIARVAERVKSGAKQTLISIDIADAGHKGLV